MGPLRPVVHPFSARMLVLFNYRTNINQIRRNGSVGVGESAVLILYQNTSSPRLSQVILVTRGLIPPSPSYLFLYQVLFLVGYSKKTMTHTSNLRVRCYLFVFLPVRCSQCTTHGDSYPDHFIHPVFCCPTTD